MSVHPYPIQHNSLRQRKKLADLSDGYRVASECLETVALLGGSGDIYDALWSICEREARAIDKDKI